MLLLLTIAINIIILTTWQGPATYSDPYPDYTITWYILDNDRVMLMVSGRYNQIIIPFAAAHIVVSSLVFISYYLYNPISLHPIFEFVCV